MTTKKYDANTQKKIKDAVFQSFCKCLVVRLCFSFLLFAEPSTGPEEDRTKLQPQEEDLGVLPLNWGMD